MKKNQPSIAKVSRPIVSGTYPRKRLFGLIDSLRKNPVIWITGPAGSGKTTLVSSYIEKHTLSCIWYRLDEGDADPASFFYYMGIAGKKAAPRKRKPLPLLTPEYLPGLPMFSKRYFEELFNRLKPPSVVVLDNYQDVPGTTGFHGMMSSGFSAIPEGTTVIVISRADPPPELARMNANNRLRTIGWDELQLTPDETKGVIKLSGHSELPDKLFHKLQEKMQGWVAGVVLLMERAKREGVELLLQRVHTPEEIFAYFAGEIFDDTDKETKEFLYKTSWLSEITPLNAEKLTGNKRADRILSALYKENFFTERRLMRTGKDYRYHPLFQDFLVSKAEAHFDRAELLELQQKAALLMEESGELESAAELLIKIGDLQRLVPFILKNAQTLAMQGRSQTLEHWLRSIPGEILGSTPWLLFWMGICRFPFDPVESREYLEKAFNLFHEQKDVAGVFMAWAGIVHSLAYGFESFKPLDRWIPLLDDLIHEYGGIPPGEIETRVATAMFGALVLRQPAHPEFDTWKERAIALAGNSPDINLRVHTIFQSNYYVTCYSGSASQALETTEQLKALALSKDITPFALLTIKMTEAFMYGFSVQKEKCIKTVEDCLKLAGESGVHVFDFIIMLQAVWISLSTGDHATARKYLGKMELLLGMVRPWDAAAYYHHVNVEAMERGDLHVAMDNAKRSLDLCRRAGEVQSECMAELSNAVVNCELKKYKNALVHVATVKRVSENLPNIKFSCLLIESFVLFRQGKKTRGLESLRQAMTIGSESGIMNTFTWQSSVMTELCMNALEAGIEAEYVQELVRRHNLVPDSPPMHLENWPWALKIYTLGRFGIVRDGKPVKSSGKTQKKPIEMLKALIAFGGRDVSEYQITDVLWPEADGDLAHRSFATTLHRLRQLLGHDGAVTLSKGFVSVDDRYCWLDTWALERMLSNADDLSGKKKKDTAWTGIKETMRLYRGAFLEKDEEQDWLLSMRERLRSKYLRYIGRTADILCSSKQCDQALSCFQKGLEIDQLAEEFYLGQMKCYKCLGRNAEGLAVYKRCEKALSTILGVEPSNKTKKIYKSLRRG